MNRLFVNRPPAWAHRDAPLVMGLDDPVLDFDVFALRAHHFHRALVRLNACVALCALASLFGMAVELAEMSQPWGIIALTAAGCLALPYAACQLFRESLLALGRINQHLDELTRVKGGVDNG